MSLILPNFKRTSYILLSFFILLLIHLFHSWTVSPLPNSQFEGGLSTGPYEQDSEGFNAGESSRLEGLKEFVGSKGAGMWDSIGASWSQLGSGLGYHDEVQEQLLEEEYEQEQGEKGEEDRKMLVESLDSLLEKLPVQWPANQTEREVRAQTLVTLKSIRECLQSRLCGSNQLKVVLAGTGRWGKFFSGHTSGENIWARSSIDAFTALGHPILYTYDALETLLIYQHIPNLVHWVFVEQGELNDCLQYGVPRRLTEEEVKRAHDFVRVEVGERGVYGWQKLSLGNGQLGNSPEQSGCIKRDGFEMGIPVWKMFIWSFWGGDGHPLGKPFTMVPEDLIWNDRDPNHNNFFLGYSVQAYAPPDPPAKDPDAPIFVLAKVPDYFDEKWFAFWDNDTTFETLSEETGLSFVAGAGAEPGGLRDKGIENKGRFTKEGFYEMMQATGVLMGCGRPTLSPSPYDALVRGTPFINPVVWWNKKDPEDRHYWKTQHDALKMLDPPYVYNVFKGDLEGLRDALVAAHNTPIPSFTPEWMSTEANIARHKEFTEKDWRAQAEDELQRQRNNDQIRIKGLLI